MITIIRTMLIGIFRDIHTLFWNIAFPLALLAGLGIYFDNPAYSERLLAGVLTMNVLFGATMVTAQRSSIREAQAGRLQHATNSLARPPIIGVKGRLLPPTPIARGSGKWKRTAASARRRIESRQPLHPG